MSQNKGLTPEKEFPSWMWISGVTYFQTCDGSITDLKIATFDTNKIHKNNKENTITERGKFSKRKSERRSGNTGNKSESGHFFMQPIETPGFFHLTWQSSGTSTNLSSLSCTNELADT